MIRQVIRSAWMRWDEQRFSIAPFTGFDQAASLGAEARTAARVPSCRRGYLKVLAANLVYSASNARVYKSWHPIFRARDRIQRFYLNRLCGLARTQISAYAPPLYPRYTVPICQFQAQ